MSANTTDDEINNLDLPVIDGDAIATGAAADSSEADERFRNLPRLLRYAMLVSNASHHVDRRLAAEIDQLCPNLGLNAGWLINREGDFNRDLGTDLGLLLAAELDQRAVSEDRPELRSLADSVRLLSLPVQHDIRLFFGEHRRVAKSLLMTFYGFVRNNHDGRLCRELEQFCFGWAALPCCSHMLDETGSAAYAAGILGALMAQRRIAEAESAVWRQIEKREEKKPGQAQQNADEAKDITRADASAAPAIPEHHLVVARLSDEQMKNAKLKEIMRPMTAVINTALPLVMAPPLHQARNALMFEFPYATEVIDFVLADLVGRATVHLRPLLLVGDPGGGKSRFARRLGEVLGLNVWREDASRADGAVFGGTDQRWYSAEPCHPFLAVSQGKIANPMVLLDEIEKASTRADYGRLWDCLLGFLEPETSCRYPDPALQVTLDLSQVSYVATANSLDPLPSPIRDRFRVITFPKPAASDLDALLPAVIADLTRERGLDSRWIAPLDGAERMAVAAHWPGGSVRRLRRLIEAILRERDLSAARN